MARIYSDITEVFGNTPLVTLRKVTDGAGATVLAKLEFYNPSASVKDRLLKSLVRSSPVEPSWREPPVTPALLLPSSVPLAATRSS